MSAFSMNIQLSLLELIVIILVSAFAGVVMLLWTIMTLNRMSTSKQAKAAAPAVRKPPALSPKEKRLLEELQRREAEIEAVSQVEDSAEYGGPAGPPSADGDEQEALPPPAKATPSRGAARPGTSQPPPAQPSRSASQPSKPVASSQPSKPGKGPSSLPEQIKTIVTGSGGNGRRRPAASAPTSLLPTAVCKECGATVEHLVESRSYVTDTGKTLHTVTCDQCGKRQVHWSS